MTLTNIKALAIREYWENRSLLYKTPMIIAIGLLLIGTISIYQLTATSHTGIGKLNELAQEHNEFKDWALDKSGTVRQENKNYLTSKQNELNKRVHQGGLALAFIISAIISFYYLSQSLFNDRRDKSILFWRSLPITEWETIASKLLVGICGFPLIYMGFATLALIGLTCVLYIASVVLGADSLVRDAVIASSVGSFPQYLKSLSWAFVMNLSLLPLYCWLLFFSAFSKKSPMLLSITLPLVAIIAEGVLLHSMTIFKSLSRFFFELYTNAEAVASLNIGSLNWGVYILSLAISIALLFGSHWLRNNRHEI